jgi:predicted transcriptional regulator
MKPYCESVAQYVIPTVRAIVAKKLMDKHKMTQQEAASKLGLTQSAISQYLRNLRGSKLNTIEKDEVIGKQIDIFVDRLASGDMNSMAAMEQFCGICKSIRKRGLLCDIHIKSFPDIKDCNLCT